jgi:DNA-binding response OmpR family regulator
MIRILLIDDGESAIFAETLSENFHFEVNWIKDAEQAIKAINHFQYDAVILDYMMPVPSIWPKSDQIEANNGLSTGSIIFNRIREKYSNMPILIYSARGSVLIDEYSSYIRKPELISDLVKELKSLLKRCKNK